MNDTSCGMEVLQNFTQINSTLQREYKNSGWRPSYLFNLITGAASIVLQHLQNYKPNVCFAISWLVWAQQLRWEGTRFETTAENQSTRHCSIDQFPKRGKCSPHPSPLSITDMETDLKGGRAWQQEGEHHNVISIKHVTGIRIYMMLYA